MRIRIRNRRFRATTALEVMVVVACVFILAVFLVLVVGQDASENRAGRARQINCISNLRQINIAFRIWEGNNKDQYPVAVSVTNGGGREFLEAGHVGKFLQVVLSNELNNLATPKILVCPADQNSAYAADWNDLGRSNISYFFGADANEDQPATILDGDDNLIVAGIPVKSGMLELSANAPVTWSETRHVRVGNISFAGNIGFADGSVLLERPNILQRVFQGTGLATNRIVIP